MQVTNIFDNIPKELDAELFQDILVKDNLKIQRIVSQGESTNDDKWYIQEDDEWVIVLQGKATISFIDESDINLNSGDYIHIPANKKHKVSWTSSTEQTVWLAVHF
ncbi:cupin domain-containing protein [Sulfurimonas sp.]|nr:cupin domain-containing protein [Sulfurimonas sp.]